jgi:hypothetical protein
MRRAWIALLTLLACSTGSAAHPGTEPPTSTAPSELDSECDARGAPFVSAKGIMDCVALGREEARCMEPFWAEYLKTHTTREGLAILQCYGNADPSIAASCHPVAHAIGRQTFVVQGTIEKSFAQCDQTCIAGCFHGVMERFLRGDADPEGHITLAELEAKAATACSPSLAQPVRFQCLHGLGHAIEYYTGYSLRPSLTVCDALPDAWSQSSCWGGVFMENIVGADPQLRDLSPTDFHYPCDAVDDNYKEQCYLIQTSRMTEMGLSPEQILLECRNAGAWRGTCIQSMGRDLSTVAVAGDDRGCAAVCEKGVGSDRVSCMTGVIYSAVDNTWSGRYAMPFCPAFLDPADAFKCFEIVAGYLARDYLKTKDQVAADCATYAPGNAACVTAARE